MNIFEYVKTLSIAGINSRTLENILRNRDMSTRIRTSGNGIVIFSDNSILKCVLNYYERVEKSNKKKTSNFCYDTISGLKIKGVDINRCVDCHLECMEMLRDGKLKRKYK